MESLLLRIKLSQLRWFDHVGRMVHKRLPRQTLYAEVNWKRPVERQRTRWLDFTEDLCWNRLGFHSSEMQSVLEDREV